MSDATPIKDQEKWKTGQDPSTAAQASHLETLGVDEVPESKAEASKKIDEARAAQGLPTTNQGSGQ